MRRLLLAATLALAGWACKEIVTAPSGLSALPLGIRAILLNTSSVRVTVGNTATVAATLLDRNGRVTTVPSGRTIDYTSSDAAVFTVSNEGLITGIAPGTGVLRAALGSLAIGIPVTVVPAGDQIRVVAGNSQTAAPSTALPLPLRIRAERANGSVAAGVTVRFTTTDGSANPAAAVTDNAGEATTTWTLGAAEGAQSLVASADGFPTSATFIATAVARPVRSITVTPATVAFTDVGQTRQLTATALDIGGQPVPVASFAWTSSDGGVATVSTTGLVTSLGSGTTTVAAAVGTISGGSRITVTLPAPQPRIGFRPATLATSAAAGAEVVAAVDVIEVNGGADAALGAVTCDAPTYATGAPSGWLVVQACGDSVRVLAQATGLSAGTYTAAIPVRAALASNSPATLPVSFVVTAAQTPIIRVNPAAVGVGVTAGGTGTLTSDITNIGGGTLSGLSLAASYTAGQPTGWINNLQLTSTTAPATLTATVGSAGLVAGTYDGAIRVSSSVANVQPVDLPVRLTVTGGGGACTPLPRPVLGADKLAIDVGNFETSLRISDDGEHIDLRNLGTGDVGTLSVRINTRSGGDFISSATLSSTTLPASLDLKFTQASSSKLIRVSDVIITSTNGGTITIPVRRFESSLNSGSTDVYAVTTFGSDPYLRFALSPTSASPTASQTRTVIPAFDTRQIVTTARIDYAAGEPTGWIAAPVFGAIGNAGRRPLTVTVNRTGLAEGVYHAVVVVDPVASYGQKPLEMPVVLEVRSCARPVLTIDREAGYIVKDTPDSLPKVRQLSYKILGFGDPGSLQAATLGIDGRPVPWASASVQPVTADSGIISIALRTRSLVQNGYPLLVRLYSPSNPDVLADQSRLSIYRLLDLRIGRALTANALDVGLSTSSQLGAFASLAPNQFTPVWSANGGVNPQFQPLGAAPDFDLGTFKFEGPSAPVGDTLAFYTFSPGGPASVSNVGLPITLDRFSVLGSLDERTSLEFRAAGSSIGSSGTWSALATGRNSTCGFAGPLSDGRTQLLCWGDAGHLIPLAGDYPSGVVQSVAAPMPVVDNVSRSAFVRGAFQADASVIDSATSLDGVSLSLGGEPSNGSATGIFLRSRADVRGQAMTFGDVGAGLVQRTLPPRTNNTPGIAPPDGSVVLPDSAALPRLKSVSMHLGRHGCGIASTTGEPGAILCWGEDDVRQSSGLGTCTQIGGPSGYFRCSTVADSIATGRNHSCAWNTVARGGQLLCWGDNSRGQLGTAGGRAGPVVGPAGSGQEFLTGVVQVSLGDEMSCAIVRETAGGQHTYCWGTGYFNGSTRTTVTVPTRILEQNAQSQVRTATEVRVGGNFACERQLFNESATDSTFGSIFCWGANDEGQTGVRGAGAVVPQPAITDLDYNMLAFDLGEAHGCAIRQSNMELRCWGRNVQGQLGDGTRSGGLQRLVAIGALPDLQTQFFSVRSAFSYPKGAFSGSSASQQRRGVTVVGRRPDGRLSEAALSRLRPDRAERIRKAEAGAPSQPPSGRTARPILR